MRNAREAEPLVTAADSRLMDGEAAEKWGLHPFALVEAAGRSCAAVFVRSCLKKNRRPLSIAVFAGGGNNAADALVMLRALILKGHAPPSACSVHITKEPVSTDSPLAAAVLAARKIGVTVTVWDSGRAAAAFAGNGNTNNVIIDGIAGTGVTAPLRGAALEMAEFVNALRRRKERPYIVSVDLPSGIFDGWRPGMPVVTADATLAVEPRKMCLYAPASRPYAGEILPVGGIFPPDLIHAHGDAELVTWESASARIPPFAKTAYKYERGLVEIWAGSPGSAGAARLAALGAQAAGAGMVRLMLDPAVYNVIAPQCSGVMAVPAPVENDGRFPPAAALLGPGWGRGDNRRRRLERFLPLEEQGLPLVLDADALALAKDITFNGNVILTPHTGEFSAYTGLPKEEILSNTAAVLRHYAAEKKVNILFKSHVMYVAAPDGRLGIIDGMNPLLGAAGSGDVLAGFCAALAARRLTAHDGRFDGYTCACAAAALLVGTAASPAIAGRFTDPGELASAAAAIAGKAWLGGGV